MSSIKSALSFLRWRVIAVRYITMIPKINASFFKSAKKTTSPEGKELTENGFITGAKLSDDKIKELTDIFEPRSKLAKKKASGHTFVNLVNESDITVDNPIMKLAFSKEVLDLAIDYFGEKLSLYSIQVLYSFKHEGTLRASQLWHKDFGDSKTQHSIYYLNDLLDDKGGPFVFTDKRDSNKINWSPFIRRIPDEQFKKELGNGIIRKVYGEKGHNIHVDPSQCYHCGSRCFTPRLAAFISFNTSTAFVGSVPFINENRKKLIEVASKLRPDISKEFFNKIIK